jgi:TRAP transporter TAXI family solute receptor
MKRNFGLRLILLLLLCTLFLISACGKKEQPAAKYSDNQPLKITFAGGAPNGVWYIVTNGVTECVNRSYPGSVVTVVPGSSIANLIRINEGQTDLSLATSTISVTAAGGNEPFKEKLSNVATVASLYPAHFQLVVDKKLGITSMDELIDRKVKIRLSVDQAGSNTEVAFKQMLSEYGVTYEDIKSWGGEIISRDKVNSSNMLSDGLIDGFTNITLYPAPPIQEAAVNKELVLLSINPDVIDRLCQKYGYSKGVIPANTYNFNDRDVASFANNAVVIVPKNAPDEVAYKVARAISENLDYLRTAHVAMQDLTPEKLTRDTGVPLHQGALKYYQESGAIK